MTIDDEDELNIERAIQLSLRNKRNSERNNNLPPPSRMRVDNPSRTWDEGLCDIVTIRTDSGVLEPSSERVKVDFTRTYRDTREFSLHNVPGDGSCFFHSVIEGMRKSSHLWRKMIDPSPLPGGPRTFCEFVVSWWARYIMTIPEVVSESNVNEHLNFRFLRYITAESITDEVFNDYTEILEHESIMPPGEREYRVFETKDAMREAVRNERGYFADDFTINVLNRVLGPFIRVVVVKQTTGGVSPPVYAITDFYGDSMSYMWVLLRNQHYYLMRKTGSHKPSDNSFLEMIPSRDNETLKYLRQDWC